MSKKAIICLHGYLNGFKHHLSFFKNYIGETEDCKIVLIRYYDFLDKKTHDYKYWKEYVLSICLEYQNLGYEITIIGYSLGCTIAGYVSTQMNVKKLIFIAPIYHILGNRILSFNFKLLNKTVKLMKKYLKIIERRNGKKEKIFPLKLIFKLFPSVSYYRKYVSDIETEILILSGKNDTIAPKRSNKYIMNHVKSQKKHLILLPNMGHYFVFDDEAQPIFDKIMLYINEDKLEFETNENNT